MRIITNSLFSFLAQLISVISGFILPRFFLQKYGSEVNGLVQSISQFLGIISFMDLGIGQVVRSALYTPLANRDNERISAIMHSGRSYYRKVAYMLVAYVIVLIFLYPSFASQSFSWPYIATMIGVLAISSFCQFYFGIVNEQLLHADQKSYIIYILQIAGTLLNLAACVWMIQRGFSIHAVKLVTSLIFVAKPLIYAAYIRRNYSIDSKVHYTEDPITQRWNGMAQHISAVVLDGTDNIVLTVFSTLTNVSVYSVYYMVISGIQRFYQSAAVGIQSAAGAAWARQDKAQIRNLFASGEFTLHSIVVFLFSCMGILILPFVRVYTDGLTDANYIQPVFAALLVIAYGIRSLRTPYNIWILAAGHYKQTQCCHITAAALNLGISILAVSRWGLVGIAIGTLIAMAYQTTWMAIYTAKHLINCTAGHLLKRAVADVAAVALACAATPWIKLQDISYFGWFVMAVQVAVIVLLCITCTSYVFYRKETLQLLRRLTRKAA